MCCVGRHGRRSEVGSKVGSESGWAGERVETRNLRAMIGVYKYAYCEGVLGFDKSMRMMALSQLRRTVFQAFL